MKDIKDLPITIQIALALKTPELFNKEQYERLMKVKNIIMKSCKRPVSGYLDQAASDKPQATSNKRLTI